MVPADLLQLQVLWTVRQGGAEGSQEASENQAR
jgi:hypothetical protein